ncbi:MAG TPA: trypsin-like serine protease, partial [Polyangiaceae bacterium]
MGGGSEPESGAVVEPIIQGDDVTADLIGTYFFNNAGNERGYQHCTATLLRDRWLITAYHCVSLNATVDSPMADPTTMTASMGFSIAAGAEVYAPAYVTPPYDVALVKLGSSLPLPTGHKVPFE